MSELAPRTASSTRVVAQATVLISIVVAILAAAGGLLLLFRTWTTLTFIVAVALGWVAVNVLVVGLWSSRASRRGDRAVVGGEVVPIGSTASVERAGAMHRLRLSTGRRLHGFLAFSDAEAARLTSRVTQLLAVENPSTEPLVTAPRRRAMAEADEAGPAADADETSATTFVPRRGRVE